MSQTNNPVVAGTLATAHALTAELRALQMRLNETIEQLCLVVDAPELARVVQARAGSRDAGQRAVSPLFMMQPLQQAAFTNPENGQSVCGDTVVYRNNRQGLFQLVQHPQSSAGQTPYVLVVNFSEFDGDLVSLVMNLKAMLTQLPAGKARWSMMLEAAGGPVESMFLKLAWKIGNRWEDRTFTLRLNQPEAAALDIDAFDPATVQAMDAHLMFNPATRGSIEIRRLSFALSVTPVTEKTTDIADIFEQTP